MSPYRDPPPPRHRWLLSWRHVAFAMLTLDSMACARDRVIQGVENAAAVAQYERLLDECKEKGKDAGSYAVYERCADKVDAVLCTHNRVLCHDAGGPDAR